MEGSTYNIQQALHAEGYFNIKSRPMGANLCLLEEQEEGDIKTMIEEDREWIERWFIDIHPWSPKDVDNERVAWMRCYGLPCHAWNPKVYAFISSMIGFLIGADEETMKHRRMDVARFLVRTKYSLVLNETINIEIKNHIYRIKLVDDMHGLKHIIMKDDSSIAKDTSMEEEEDNDEEGSVWYEDESESEEDASHEDKEASVSESPIAETEAKEQGTKKVVNDVSMVAATLEEEEDIGHVQQRLQKKVTKRIWINEELMGMVME